MVNNQLGELLDRDVLFIAPIKRHSGYQALCMIVTDLAMYRG